MFVASDIGGVPYVVKPNGQGRSELKGRLSIPLIHLKILNLRVLGKENTTRLGKA